MARIRRTAKNEPAAPRKPEGDRPEIVVHDPTPKAAPDQKWSVTSFPFYEPEPAP